MLQIAIALITLASLYSVYKAPKHLRMFAALAFVVPPVIGYVAGYLLSTTKDTLIYYPIAAAIAGWAIGAIVYEKCRQQHVKKAVLMQIKAQTSAP